MVCMDDNTLLMVELVIIALIIVFFWFDHIKENKAINKLMEIKKFEQENRDNHRLTFHCTCNKCIKNMDHKDLIW